MYRKKFKSMQSCRNMQIIKLMCIKNSFCIQNDKIYFCSATLSMNRSSITRPIKIIPGLILPCALQWWKLCLHFLYHFILTTNLSRQIFFSIQIFRVDSPNILTELDRIAFTHYGLKSLMFLFSSFV